MSTYTMTFEISEKELKSLAVWQRSQEKKTAKMFSKDELGIPARPLYSYHFYPSGIGTVVEVTNERTSDTINITDYASW